MQPSPPLYFVCNQAFKALYLVSFAVLAAWRLFSSASKGMVTSTTMAFSRELLITTKSGRFFYTSPAPKKYLPSQREWPSVFASRSPHVHETMTVVEHMGQSLQLRLAMPTMEGSSQLNSLFSTVCTGSWFNLPLLANGNLQKMYLPFPIHSLLMGCIATEWKLFPWSTAALRASSCFLW